MTLPLNFELSENNYNYQVTKYFKIKFVKFNYPDVNKNTSSQIKFVLNLHVYNELAARQNFPFK